jgi:hypothetical protein
MGRVRSKKVSENNVLIKRKIIKYKMTISTLLLLYYYYYTNSIQFNSIYYLRAESTATRPITDTAQRR